MEINGYTIEPGASLVGADLSGANLANSNLKGADLMNADLSGAKLRDAILREANLMGADLSGGEAPGVNLIRANLSGANLSNSLLWHAHLCDADLSGSILIATNFTGADLSGARLLGGQDCGTRFSRKPTFGAQSCLTGKCIPLRYLHPTALPAARTNQHRSFPIIRACRQRMQTRCRRQEFAARQATDPQNRTRTQDHLDIGITPMQCGIEGLLQETRSPKPNLHNELHSAVRFQSVGERCTCVDNVRSRSWRFGTSQSSSASFAQ